MQPAFIDAREPAAWVLVFSRTSKTWWVRWLAWGRYQHVKAFAFVPAVNVYVFYDWALDRQGIVVAPNNDETVKGYLAEFIDGCDLISAPLRVAARPRVQFGFLYCVPAIKHLIGLRSRALRPDRLWRDCLAAGGTTIGRSIWQQTAVRPAPARSGAGGTECAI